MRMNMYKVQLIQIQDNEGPLKHVTFFLFILANVTGLVNVNE